MAIIPNQIQWRRIVKEQQKAARVDQVTQIAATKKAFQDAVISDTRVKTTQRAAPLPSNKDDEILAPTFTLEQVKKLSPNAFAKKPAVVVDPKQDDSDTELPAISLTKTPAPSPSAKRNLI